MGLIECVPNFSEGRDQTTIRSVVEAAAAVKGVVILDVESDADHNRSVLSFAAPPEAAVEACFKVAEKSRALIDLNRHQGEHPRMGAVDVIPFIPISGASIEDCVELAERLAEKIGRELQIPVYLYDRAAKRPDRKDLAAVRKGQFEGLREAIGKDPERDPDFGPRKIHPTAGAVAVGAREQIINFNVNLDSSDMDLGRSVARKIRASGGGLPAVRAKEIFLKDRNQVQISTVLTDYKTTGVSRVLGEISRLAAEKNAEVLTTEIVGLVPENSLLDFALAALRLENFDPEGQILERRLKKSGIGPEPATDWLSGGKILADALSSQDPTPGGGSAAAMAGAMGCGLAAMALAVSLKSKKTDPSKRPEILDARKTFSDFKERLLFLAEKDAAAFDGVVAAFKTAKTDPLRQARIDEALVKAAQTPLQTAETCSSAFRKARVSRPLTGTSVRSDLNCALHLLKAAAFCAAENVAINLESLGDKSKAPPIRKTLDACLEDLRQNK